MVLVLALAVVLLGCVAAPLVASVLGRRAGWVLAVPLLVAAGVTTAALPVAPHSVHTESWPWLPSLGVAFSLRLDGLSLVFALAVLVIGALVMVYSTRYLDPDGRHRSFFALMTGFAAAMLVLVLADDLVVLFVAWEATTFCSFLLIARSGDQAHRPAVRTLIVTASGGLCLLGAITTMAVGTGTTHLQAVLASPRWGADATWTTTVAVLLAVAAFTKSAQFPFHAWLPDSMAAITPVSTYLHAAAMVKAGLYVLLRFSSVLAGQPVWTTLLLVSGSVTAALGAVAALRRDDLKELLAYSTISQLGLVVATIGVGTETALKAATAHTIAHALFKAALFMLVGVLDVTTGTRRISHLATMRLRQPATAVGFVLAAASMAGVPLLLGFVTKEAMFEAFLDAPFTPFVTTVTTAVIVGTAVLTFAYCGRIVLGALGGRRLAPDAPRHGEVEAAFWIPAVLPAAAGAVLGIAPFLLSPLVSDAVTDAMPGPGVVEVDLALWHGVNPALGLSALVLALGTALVLARRPVEAFLRPRGLGFSALTVVENVQHGAIAVGEIVAGWAGPVTPRRSLAVGTGVACAFAAIVALTLPGLPPPSGDRSLPEDWALVALVAASVVAALRARTRLAALIVVGVAGFAMTLWFLTLGAVDVALTQLIVEILTVCVMVLLLARLPERFTPDRWRHRIGAAALAVGAGVAVTAGTWALTGRRGPSEVGEYYLREGQHETGGANVVATILAEFRAFDTLGELTVLAAAGLTIGVLVAGRRLAPVRPAPVDETAPLTDPAANAVFLRMASRVLVPLLVVGSLVLFWRGHQAPGGAFLAALLAGTAYALAYLAAPSPEVGRRRLPWVGLLGAGVVVGVSTGLFGYLAGSFLTPAHTEVAGVKLTSSLVLELGVYLGVLGLIVAAFELLGSAEKHAATETSS